MQPVREQTALMFSVKPGPYSFKYFFNLYLKRPEKVCVGFIQSLSPKLKAI